MRGLIFRLLHALPPDAYRPALAQAYAAGADTVCLVSHHYTQLQPVPQGGNPVVRPFWEPRSYIWRETAQMPGGVGNSTPLENVVEVAKVVRALGMDLWLAPHIDCGEWHGTRYEVGGWRFYLSVKDIYHSPPAWSDRSRAWESAYRAFLRPYVTWAKRLNAGLVMGCELGSVTREMGAAVWVRLATTIRDGWGFYGPLTYAANWMGEQEYLDPLWQHPAISAIGVDFYPPAARWDAMVADMRAQAARCGKPILLTEVGCSNYLGAEQEPGADPPPNAVPDDATQIAFWERVNATWGATPRLAWEAPVIGLEPPPISHNVMRLPAVTRLALGGS